MPFEKGRTKVGGRVKGSQNKKQIQWDELGDFMTNKGAERAMKVLSKLDDETYLDQYGKLLNYFKPRHQASTIDANVTAVQPIVFENVSKDYSFDKDGNVEKL